MQFAIILNISIVDDIIFSDVGDYKYLAMELAGPSLGKIRDDMQPNHFPYETVLKLGIKVYITNYCKLLLKNRYCIVLKRCIKRDIFIVI